MTYAKIGPLYELGLHLIIIFINNESADYLLQIYSEAPEMVRKVFDSESLNCECL